MIRLRILMIALACVGLGVFLIPVVSQTESQAQPPQAKSQELKDALKKIEVMKEEHERKIELLDKKIRLLVAQANENIIRRRSDIEELAIALAAANAEIAALIQKVKPASVPKGKLGAESFEEMRAKLAKINQELATLWGDDGDKKKEGEPKAPPKKEDKKAIDQRLQRIGALQAERDLLMVALKDALLPTAGEKNEATMRMLREVIPTAELGKVKLKTVLEYFFEKSGGTLPILVDVEAFTAELGPDRPDPYEEEVSLPPVPSKMSIGVALRLVLSQVGKGQATFVIRQGYIEITTVTAAAAAQALAGSTFLASYDSRPLPEVLEDLSGKTGLDINLDPNVGKKATVLIKATFKNTTLEDALVTVTEMAELKFVVLDRSIYVTTPERAEVLRKAQKERNRKHKEARPMPMKPVSAS